MSPPRFVAASFTLVLLLLLASAGPAAAANLGCVIRPGDSVDSAIAPAGDTDPFVFEAVAGTSFNASVKRAKGSLLEPDLRLVDPLGSEIDLTGLLKKSTKSVSLKKLVLPVTGRYGLVVSGANGSAGGYQLKTSGKPAKGIKRKGEILRPGETADLVFGGIGDALLSLSIKIKTKGGGLTVLDLLDAAGKAIPGFDAALKPTPKKISLKTYLTGPFGEFTLRLGNAVGDTTHDVSLKVKFPKVKKAKLTMGEAEPQITDVYASISGQPFGSPGGEVTIEGSGFATTGSEVWFGDASATIRNASADRIRATLPEGTGEVDVAVLNPDGNLGLAGSAFTYVGDPPRPKTITPAVGPAAGGTPVTMTGDGLSLVTTVRVGVTDLVAPPTVVNDTTVTFTTEAHAAGTYSVYLIDEFGQPCPFPQTFEFIGPPELAGVNPGGGSVSGGTVVRVHGPNAAWWREVWLDGVLQTTAVFPPDGLEFTTSPHAGGTVDLRVVDTYGQESVVADGFEFNYGGFLDQTGLRLPESGLFSQLRGRALRFADVDKDGDDDILLGREEASGSEKLLKLLVSDGAGYFTDASASKLPTVTEDLNGDLLHAADLALGDIDDDGDLDLVAVTDTLFTNPAMRAYGPYPGVNAYNSPYSSTRVFRNDGKGTFTQITTQAMPSVKGAGSTLFQAECVALGDLDGDDDLDLVVARDKEPRVATYTDVMPTYSWYPFQRTFDTDYGSALESVNAAMAMRVLLNDGDGTFKDKTGTNLPALGGGDMFTAEQIALLDVEGDGDLDIVITIESSASRNSSAPEFVNGAKTGSASKTRILLNNGTGAFTNGTSTLMPRPLSWDDWSGHGLTVGDIDGDTHDDLVVTTNRELSFPEAGAPNGRRFVSRTRVFRGSASGAFTEDTGDTMPAVRADGKGDVFAGFRAAIEDLDGDGKPDLVLVSKDPVTGKDPFTGDFDRKLSATRVLLNDGSGALENETLRRLPDPVYSGDDLRGHAVILGDLDGDKNVDILLSTTHEITAPTRALIFR